MPFDKSKYPLHWKQFSEYIRFDRAQDRCERCQVRNGAYVVRGKLKDRVFWFDLANGECGDAETGVLHGRVHFSQIPLGHKETKIVLTVAHLDHEEGVCRCKAETGLKCAKPEHVLALCQRCHLALDMPKHIANRKKTLTARKDAGRGLFERMGSIL